MLLDSLKKIIYSIEDELQYIKKNMVAGKSGIDELILLLYDEEADKILEDQRSRRKRIDALFDLIT